MAASCSFTCIYKKRENVGHQQWLEIVVQAYHITQILLREILVNIFNSYHLTLLSLPMS